jgi:hypothetical protein
VIASHGLLVGGAAVRLARVAVRALFVTDSRPVQADPALPIEVRSIAGLIAGEIGRLHRARIWPNWSSPPDRPAAGGPWAIAPPGRLDPATLGSGLVRLALARHDRWARAARRAEWIALSRLAAG